MNMSLHVPTLGKSLLMLACWALSAAPGKSQDFFSIDMNAYTSRRAFESRDVAWFSMWKPADTECGASAIPFELTNAFESVSKSSQSNFYDMVRYGVKFSNQMVGPIERQFFLQSPYLNILTYPEADKIYACLTGLFYRKDIFIDNQVHYFELLVKQIEYILDELDGYPFTKNGQSYECRILRSAKDMDEVMASPNKTGILLSVSGGHALSAYYLLEEQRYKSNAMEFENTIMTNIDRLKGVSPIRVKNNKFLDVPIFSIQFGNCYDDGIVGKSVLFSVAEEEAFGKQTTLGKNFTELGLKVIERLLDNSKGRRILIDVSGMSVDAREAYYKYLQERRFDKDTIPVIASGVGISGMKRKDEEYANIDEKVKAQSTMLNHRQANLCREDIIEILKSKGLIALSLDRDKLMGKYFQTRYNATMPGSAERRRVVVEAIVANICKAVHSCNSKEAWDMIAIGSQLDNHGRFLTPYNSSDDLRQLGKDLLDFFEAPRDIDNVYTAKEIASFMYNLTPEQIVERIMFKNAFNFIKKHLQKVEKNAN